MLLLAGRRVRSVCDRRRRRLDRRLDHGLLASFLRHALLVGARHLDLLVGRAAAARAGAAGAAAARRTSAAAARTATAAGPLPAALAGTAAAHGAEALAILVAVAAGLARGAEALGDTAATAGRVLVAQARLLAAAGNAAVALRHDLALVDPDLDADAAGRGARLDEAVVDVGANRVQRDAALGVLLRPAHLRAAKAARALHLHAGGA